MSNRKKGSAGAATRTHPNPSRGRAAKQRGGEAGSHCWKNPKSLDFPVHAEIPVSCSAFALGFAVPGKLPSVEKPNQITWTNQPGSKVAKCDLRGEGLAEEGPVRGRNSKGWSSSTDRDDIPSKCQEHTATLPISQLLAPPVAPWEAPMATREPNVHPAGKGT